METTTDKTVVDVFRNPPDEETPLTRRWGVVCGDKYAVICGFVLCSVHHLQHCREIASSHEDIHTHTT